MRVILLPEHRLEVLESGGEKAEMRAEFNFGRRVGGGIVTTTTRTTAVVRSRHQNHVTKIVVRPKPEIRHNLLKTSKSGTIHFCVV